MKNKIHVLPILLLMIIPSVLYGANSDTTTINYSVSSINEIDFGTVTKTFTSNTATAGQQPDQLNDDTLTYSITTNCASKSKKIVVSINEDLPDHVFIQVSPYGERPAGTGAWAVVPTTSPFEILYNISACVHHNLTWALSFWATVEAGTFSGSKTLTFTLVDS